MSWSVSIIGTPEKVAEKLEEQRKHLSGQSLEEYEAALPCLKTLVAANVGKNVMVDLDASGSASKTDGVVTHSSCSVSLKQLYRTIALVFLFALVLALPSIAQAGPLRTCASSVCSATKTVATWRSDVRQSRREDRQSRRSNR